MKVAPLLFWAVAPILVLVQISQATPSTPAIFDVHESIESLSNVLQLQETMSDLNIHKMVLQGIPKDILYYTEKKDISLADSTNNNALVAQVAAQTKVQDTFGFFCTIDPLDLERVNKMEDCLKLGGLGIKLYNGYSYAHVIPVDDVRLSELYKKLSDEGGVLMLALNSGEYQSELENVLSLNPSLPVICPHYCLASQSLDRLRDLMTRFPTLYIDTSFGQESLARTGFETLNSNHDAFVQFFTDFQDRILFGTDNVVTDYEDKDKDFLKDLYQDYIGMLSKGTIDGTYQGLELSYPILRKVLWQNAADLLQ
jgi:predicted TIM-barrel fold metal-dependent hydrolase